MRILALSAYLLTCCTCFGAISLAPYTNDAAVTISTTATSPAASPEDQGEADREHMQLYTVAHIDALAVCNDGSPGAYYWRTGSNSTSWVIRFLGGAWCWDGPSCAVRNSSTPFLMSSALLPPATSADAHSPGRRVPDVFLQTRGITSTDPAQNPSFHGWNQVHIWYCSSDSHLGDTSTDASSEFGGLHFRGKRIAAAVVADLLATRGLANATEVLLTGDSAGGVGAMNNADWLAGLMRAQAPDLATVRLFVDGGWFLDMPPYANRSDGMTFSGCAHAIADLYNGTFDRNCAAAQAPGQAWRCFFAAATWRHMATPTLFHEYLYDSANLNYDGASPAQYGDFRQKLEASFLAPEGTGSSNSSSGSVEAGVAGWPGLGGSVGGGRVQGGGGGGGWDASAVQGAALAAPPVVQNGGAPLLEVDPTLASSTAAGQLPRRRPNVFSPACRLHEMIDGVQFTTSHVGSRKLTDVLAAWFGGGLHEVFLLDDYEGVRGRGECGVDPAEAAGLSAVQFYVQP